MSTQQELPVVTIKARFDGRAFVPETPVELPVGSVVEIPLPQANSRPGSPTLMALAKIAEEFPDDSELPADMAAQVDHYLYGLPKKP